MDVRAVWQLLEADPHALETDTAQSSAARGSAALEQRVARVRRNGRTKKTDTSRKIEKRH